MNLTSPKTRMTGLSYSLIRLVTIPECDRRTDRRNYYDYKALQHYLAKLQRYKTLEVSRTASRHVQPAAALLIGWLELNGTFSTELAMSCLAEVIIYSTGQSL